MAITIDRVPANLRVPGVYAEINNSNALSGAQRLVYRRLIIATMLAGGTAVAGVPVQCLSEPAASGLFGAGSVAHGMVAAAIANDPFTDLYVLPIGDPGAGVAATQTLTVTGNATAASVLSLYVAGRLVQVSVAAADTPTLVAGKIVTAVTAATSLPVTATAAVGVVTFTAKNKGATGNDIDIRANYNGEKTPAGLTLAFVAPTNGAGNPDITANLAALGDSWFQAWATAYTDTTNLAAIETDQYNRWGPLRESEGHVFGALRGTYSAVAAIGLARNSEHLTLVQSIKEPTPAYEKAAETMSIYAQAVANDPARPVQNLPYLWAKPAIESDRLTITERNVLLFDGIATTKVTAGGVMQAERLITTYKTNSAGGTDVSFLDSETQATLLYLRHDLKDRILRKFPRSKLADDGNRFGPGQDIVTPKSFKAELVAWAMEMQEIGIVENIDSFKALTFSERDVGDRNRLNNLVVPDLVNQLRIVANKIQFIL